MPTKLIASDNAAVTALLARRVSRQRAVFDDYVELVAKGSKRVRTILVLTATRLILGRPGVKLGAPLPVLFECHWLELSRLAGTAVPDEVTLTTSKKETVTFAANRVDRIVQFVRQLYAKCFFGAPEPFQLAAFAPGRLKDVGAAPRTPVAGFALAYASLCDLHGARIRGDLLWDIDNVYGPNNIREFNLDEFDALTPADVRALVGALAFNSHFTRFVARKRLLSKDDVQWIAAMLQQNASIDDVVLPHCAIGGAGAVLLGDAVAKNARSAVLRLDLADNAIDDKGLQALATALQGLAHGVVHVDVSSNGAGARGTAALARALKLNAHNATTLVHLNLSNNAFDKDGSTALAAWLAQPNPLRVLLLANTQLSIDIVVNAILRGCTSLEQLDLAGNRVRKEDSGALPKLLQSTPALHTLDLSRTQLPLDALDALLKAARQNPYLSQNFKLLLQDNALGTRGAQLLAQLAPQNLTVTSLDLADNEFGDEGIAILATALSNNTFVKHLNIDGGFRQASKHTTEQRRNAVDCLKTLIASSCPLESLSMRGRTANGRGCALGDDLTDLLYELGSNESLLSLDVSGHDSRDGGAAALAKALLSNEKLRSVAIDENGTTIAGFESVRAAMRTNFSLLSFAVPLADYVACAKTLPPAELDHVRHTLAEINRLVARNHAPAARYEHATGGAAGTGAGGGAGTGGAGTGGAGGSSGSGGDDGFTAAQAEVERRAQKMRSVTSTLSDEQAALLSDADQVSKDLWSALARTRDQHLQACAGELREQLAKCVADLLLPTLARHKREMVDSVMRVVQSHVGTMQDEDSRRLQMSVDFGARDVSADDVARVVTDRCTAELGGKVRACFASAVDIALEGVCEKLIDRITEAEADNLARSSVRLKSAATITAELEEDNREPQTPRELNYQTLRRRPQSAIHDDADADAQVDEEALEEVDLGAPEGVPTHAVEMIDLNDDELDAIMPDLPVPEPPDEPASDGDNDNDGDDDDAGAAAAPDDPVAAEDDERAPPPPPVDSDNEDDVAAPVAPEESPAPAAVPKPKALSPEVAATKAVPSLPAKVASAVPSAAAKSPPPSTSPKPAAPAAATKPTLAQPLPKVKSGGGGLFGLLRKKDAPAGKAEAGKAAPKAKPAAAAAGAAAAKKVVAAAAVDVANLPKVQSNLQHVTKDRAAFAPKKRRPPTRRPRKDDQV